MLAHLGGMARRRHLDVARPHAHRTVRATIEAPRLPERRHLRVDSSSALATLVATFLASAVESVEAVTIVLAG
jgi:hypothetical protein